MPPELLDPIYWETRQHPNGQLFYYCLVCRDGRERLQKNAKKHEQSQVHQNALLAFTHETSTSLRGSLTQSQEDQGATLRALSNDALRALLASGTSNPSQPLYPPTSGSYNSYGEPNFPDSLAGSQGLAASPPRMNWLAYEALEDTTAQVSPSDQLHQSIFQKTLDFLNNGNLSDFSEEECPDSPDTSTDSDGDEVQHPILDNEPRKRARFDRRNAVASSDEWYPWADRITCTLDILMHLPRSVFSRKQLDLFLWLLRVNKVDDVPSVKSMNLLNKIMQELCGVDTITYKGKQGHVYHVNNLGQLLAQEMANPQVAPKLYFYPEDSGKRVSEARQANRWLHELPSDETTPMIRVKKTDYYIFEPTMLNDGSLCIPHRWFTREGRFFAKAWQLEAHPATKDNVAGWIVYQDNTLEICETQLLKNFPDLARDFRAYNIPDPSVIHGIRSSSSDPELRRWDLTNPVLGNPWRERAKGHRVLAMPLSIYCDDTSGNTSKKWNEHNSFLFTLAGLPLKESAKEYNIHYLCTSNTAPPLEMMDGVVEQIEEAQKTGIWAWDCVHKELVMLFPTVLMLLGDNPMHSEFACHIGLRGKYFCRTCWVKGTDAQDAGILALPNDDNHHEASPAPSRNVSPAPSEEHSSAPPSPTTSVSHAKKTRGKFVEDMSAMLTRIKSFIKPARLRNKDETLKILDGYFQEARDTGAKSRLKIARTNTGIKDTMQEFFLERLFNSYKSAKGAAKQKALDKAIDDLPPDIKSPVWRLKGLDPHQDTPVELLHVVLLGFVKYFWRDLISNQIKNDTARKTLLIQRLNSFDVISLGLSPLGGDTLVNYANSLTGRDFRAISQVAPFVIYDMVAPEVFDAWLALSKLVPLVYQPIIEDIDEFIVTLEHEIHHFLLQTARWTCGWFNKAKFHIFLHLPNHIRRFGPAVLFATESFESFNAVIRAKSVHSNRLAPSRDIALAFAQGNRIRHLLSGGYFPKSKELDLASSKQSDWIAAGAGPKNLIAADNTLGHYLGIPIDTEASIPGLCRREKAQQQRQFNQTLTGLKLPELMRNSPNIRYVTCDSLHLQNTDVCSLNQYILFTCPSSMQPMVGCVREILQQVDSPNYREGKADGVLLQLAHVPDIATKFQMPRLALQDQWAFIPFFDILCTVNAPHNCEQHECSASGSEFIYQERVRTEHRRQIIEHKTCPDDRILNTAKMRDAIHIQKFRIPSKAINIREEEEIIMQSVRKHREQEQQEQIGVEVWGWQEEWFVDGVYKEVREAAVLPPLHRVIISVPQQREEIRSPRFLENC
ncbi:hypothetical protein BJ912DRAFT_1150335 [Pholiota molesta]|nr:hypothetical protein BJ912DRAFT_1150335 [Pholiota molesta]